MDYSPDQINSMFDHMLRSYMLKKAEGDIGEGILSRIFPNEKDKLEVERDKLDIAMRKRALGLPMDDTDYDEAVNEKKPIVSRATTLAGKSILQMIPRPLGDPKKPYFVIAHAVEDSLPSITKSVAQGGVSRYAHDFERIRSFF